MNSRVAAAWLVAALIVGALLFGFFPVTANGVSCGSALSGGSRTDTAVAQYGDDLADALAGQDLNGTNYEAACADRRSTQRMFVIPILILGVLGGGFLLLTRRQTAGAQPRAR
jgi:hypothetical protein